MPATLAQIQARLEQATALRDDAQEAMPAIVAAGGSITAEVLARHQGKLNGYQREAEILLKLERNLIANGRLEDADLDQLNCGPFNASEVAAAAETLLSHSGAQTAPREAPRNDVSTSPLPAAGDVF